jgi:hypothetical protein
MLQNKLLNMYRYMGNIFMDQIIFGIDS